LYFSASSSEISLLLRNSSTRLFHSALKRSAPVKLPSPPTTTKASIPFLIRFKAALVLPSLVLKARHLAVPITVPPYKIILLI